MKSGFSSILAAKLSVDSILLGELKITLPQDFIKEGHSKICHASTAHRISRNGYNVATLLPMCTDSLS